MKFTIIQILFLLLFCPSFSQVANPEIQGIISLTNLDTLVTYVRELSGEDSVMVNGNKVKIQHRVSSYGNDLAADYIYQKLNGYGLATINQVYSQNGRNVIATQTGTAYPDKKFIICAHYDAVADYCADDNASGVAAVLETARILSEYEFPYTVVYALWDEEETGCFGSRYYANQAFNNGTQILDVLNLEMFGWDSNNDNLFEIHTRPVAFSNGLADSIVLVNSFYNLQLNPDIENPGTTASDHSSFWDKGYSAVVFSQAFYNNDFNPYYHSAQDRINQFNLPYFYKLSKLAVGTMAHLAWGSQRTSVNEVISNILDEIEVGVYPNPFSEDAKINFSLPEDRFITVSLLNEMGAKLDVLYNDFHSKGLYSIDFSGSHLPNGVYYVVLQTFENRKAFKMILAR